MIAASRVTYLPNRADMPGMLYLFCINSKNYWDFGTNIDANKTDNLKKPHHEDIICFQHCFSTYI